MTYDLTKLNELSGGDKEFNHSIVEVFLEETPADAQALAQAIQAGNMDLIYQCAHKIKPNADLLGIEVVRDAMLAIEDQTKTTKDLSRVKGFFTTAQSELQRAYTFYQSYLTS